MTIEDPTIVKNFRSVEPEDLETIYSLLPSAKWTPDGSDSVEFQVFDVQESMSNELALRRRPYRNGAKVDDIGANAKIWTMRAVFNNTLAPGQYPDAFNAVISSMDKHVTGDLILPIRGLVRAKGQDYSAAITADEIDQGLISLTFVEDNEDGVGAQNFNTPSAAGSTSNIAEQAEFDAQSEGMWNGSIQNLKQFSAQLQGLANAPGQYAQDLETMHNTLVGETENIIKTFSQQGEEGRDLLLSPESSKAQRDFELIMELAGQSRQDARQGSQQIITKKYVVEQSIFQIATIEGQSADSLIKINGQLSNLFSIPANTPVRMYSDAQAAG